MPTIRAPYTWVVFACVLAAGSCALQPRLFSYDLPKARLDPDGYRVALVPGARKRLPLSATTLYKSDPVPAIVEVVRRELESTGRFARVGNGMSSVGGEVDLIVEVTVTDMVVRMPGESIALVNEAVSTWLNGPIGWLMASSDLRDLMGAVRVELELFDPDSGYETTRAYVGHVRKRLNERERRSSTAKRWVLGIAVSEAMRKMKKDVPRIISRIESERAAGDRLDEGRPDRHTAQP